MKINLVSTEDSKAGFWWGWLLNLHVAQGESPLWNENLDFPA